MYKDYLTEYQRKLRSTLAKLDSQEIEPMALLIEEAILKRKKIFILGNGGSAAAATHWACDFNKGVATGHNPKPRFISLSDNLSTFTAIANDISYDDVFSYQMQDLIETGDVVIGLSVSGQSKNIIKAMQLAKTMNASSIAIIGDYHGEMEKIAALVVHIPSKNYGIVEDIHLIIDHSLSQYLAEKFSNISVLS